MHGFRGGVLVESDGSASADDISEAAGGSCVTPHRTRGRTPRTLFLNHAANMGGAAWVLLDIARDLRSACSVVLFADGPARTHLQCAGVSFRCFRHRVPC